METVVSFKNLVVGVTADFQIVINKSGMDGAVLALEIAVKLVLLFLLFRWVESTGNCSVVAS